QQHGRGWPAAAAAAAADSFTPDTDVLETPGRYSVYASLAGAKKDDVKVSWDPDTCELSIEGVISRPRPGPDLGAEKPEPEKEQEQEQEQEQQPAGGTLRFGERQTGRFVRRLYLGPGVDAERLAAGLEDGVLTVHVPRREGAGERAVRLVEVV
ncbi:hypothetical protein E4U41_004798, partial [Claviceps citrina]